METENNQTGGLKMIYILTVVNYNGIAVDYEFKSESDRSTYFNKLLHSDADKFIKGYTFTEIEKEA